MSAAVPRIAICGAGISGLTLAGILSRTLAGRVRLTVIERAPVDRDQGYGLDLDEHGQEALVRAGVYHRYWEISRPFSDTMAFYPIRGSEPLGVLFRPALLRRLLPWVFAARPETNRGALRDVLLEAIAERKNTEVHFDTPVRDLRALVGGGVELLDGEGSSLGEFDLVVDAMGLHSTLRHHRVDDAGGGKHFTGNVLVHGVIRSPDDACRREIADRMRRYGTMIVWGRGYGLILQRFGAGPSDDRTSVFYALTHLDDEETLFREIGIAAPDSRAAGILRDERRGKVKAWILADMGDAFDPVWQDVIRQLDRVTVRGEFTHGDSSLRPHCALPLVCIGDSQRNCGLGGGGILAMRDAIELSKLLESAGAFDVAGRPDLLALRAAEETMMRRKQQFASAKAWLLDRLRSRIDQLGRGPASLDDFFPSRWSLALARLTLPALGSLSNAWYRRDERRLGRVGSDASTTIYPNVRKLLQHGDGGGP